MYQQQISRTVLDCIPNIPKHHDAPRTAQQHKICTLKVGPFLLDTCLLHMCYKILERNIHPPRISYTKKNFYCHTSNTQWGKLRILKILWHWQRRKGCIPCILNCPRCFGTSRVGRVSNTSTLDHQCNNPLGNRYRHWPQMHHCLPDKYRSGNLHNWLRSMHRPPHCRTDQVCNWYTRFLSPLPLPRTNVLWGTVCRSYRPIQH